VKAKLSMAFEDLRGKDGNVVISMSRTGLILRPRVKAANPRTAPQKSVRANLTKAAESFRALPTNQITAWQAYAQAIVRKNSISGHSYSPTAIDVYVGLISKLLQVNPSSALPMNPPSAPFLGDTITVTAAASTGKITFTASAANAAGVTTEVLIQPLKSKNRKPYEQNYRSQGFKAFAAGSLTKEVTVGAGYYAAAYRFVNTSTGQETELIPLGSQAVTMALAETNKKAA